MNKFLEKPTRAILLACAIVATCQSGMANPENPNEDARLKSFNARIFPMQLPNFPDGLYPKDAPLPEDITEYPDREEDQRYRAFKEIRLQANPLFENGLLTAPRAGEFLKASLPLIHSDYPNYRIHYWVLFADLALCMTPTNGLLQMEREDILGIARNFKLVVDAMDRSIIPDFKGYWGRPWRSGFILPGPGEKVYSYNGLQTTKREDIYQFMRQERILETKECMNVEQTNLPRFRSMIASTIKSMIAIANATEETP